MKLTPTAQKLYNYRQTDQTDDMDQDIDTLASCMGSEDFSYALYEGGYLKPEEWVEGEDLAKINNAIKVLEEFKDLVESLHNEF